jgi:AcrR family transcriptional regulator
MTTLTDKSARKRTRLSPEARRDQILDVAKRLVLETGLQKFSLKNLAVEAQVSEPLLFHYFSSRIELLQELLKRDFQSSIRTLNSALDNASSLDDLLRVYVSTNYDQCDEESVINILLAEPEIAEAVKLFRSENSVERRQWLIDRLSESLGVRKKKAAMLALMASSASISGARFANDYGVGREEAIEMVMRFIKAGIEDNRDAPTNTVQINIDTQ